MQNIEPEVCPDAEKIVNGVLRGFRRRGLPSNVDADDLRQEGLIALATNRVETQAHAATIARNAMLDYLRKGLRRNKQFYTGIQSTEDSGGTAKITADPWHVLGVDGQEARHLEWERERKERWA
jgi:DNA-directed RNA polymerase specialized sigma24 family protein